MNLKLCDRRKIRLYAILTIILIFTKYVEYFSIYSISGFLLTNILFYTWVISTIFILYKYWAFRIAKVYLITLLTSVISLSVFAGILTASITYQILGFGTSKIFKLKEDIVIQAARGTLSGDYIVIFEDHVIFKKRLGHQKDSFIAGGSIELMIKDASDAKLVKKSNDSITVEYYWEIDTLTINHKVKSYFTK